MIIKSRQPLYGVWDAMKQRCFNPNAHSFKDYGGRGIKVCNLWLDFNNFEKWAYKNGYTMNKTKNGVNKLTLDRIDNDGDYEPSNCRFVSMSVQNSNRRTYGKREFIGVYRRKHGGYEGRVQLNGIVIFRTYGKTAEEVAIKRNNYILQNKLPHRLNKFFLGGKSL